MMEIINYFKTVVKNEMDKGKESHVWLSGLYTLMDSKVYAESVFEDVCLFCKETKGKKVLDFGTGSGLISMLLSEKGYDVVGIDIDNFAEHTKDMAVDQKEIWAKFMKKYPIILRHYDKVIPYPDNYFDSIIAYAVIEHIPDKDIDFCMQEIKRVVKPGGILFISKLPRELAYIEKTAKLLKLGYHNRLYGDKEIKKLLKEYGFIIKFFSLTDLIPAYPAKIVNKYYRLLKCADKIFIKTPLKYLAHNMRIICKNV